MIGDFITLITIGLMGLMIGGLVWKKLVLRAPFAMEWFGLVLPIGLGLAGLILGVSASLGSLQTGIVLVLLSTSIGLFHFRQYIQESFLKKSFVNLKTEIKSFPLVALLILILIAWLGLQSPVTDGDALCYHLEVAKRIAASGRVQFDPDLHETAYPLLVESLQAAVLKLRGPVATRAISFWFGLSLAFSASLLAQPLVGQRNSIYAALIILSSPIVNCGMISPLNDVPLASLCASAFAALVVLDQQNISIIRRSIISGLLCGLACGVKFPGIVWSAVIGMYLFALSFNNTYRFSRKSISNIKPVGVFVLVLLIVGGYWYARSALLTGNPVHPYFRHAFGGHGLDEVLEDARKSTLAHIWNILTAPVGLSLIPSHYDSFSHQIGPLFLALIPLGFLRRYHPLWYLYLVIGSLEISLCLTQRQSPRFYIAALVPWSASACVVFVDILERLNSSSPKITKNKAILLPLFAIVFLISSFNLARVRHGALMLAGLKSPSQWLIENEPTAQLSHWVDLNLPLDARLIGQDHRGFYWPRPFTMEKAHRRRTGLLKNQPSVEFIIQHFLDQGFSHLVMAEPDSLNAVEFDTDLSLYMQPWTESHQPIMDCTLHESDGYHRRYRIFDLKFAPKQTCIENKNIPILQEAHDLFVQPFTLRTFP